MEIADKYSNSEFKNNVYTHIANYTKKSWGDSMLLFSSTLIIYHFCMFYGNIYMTPFLSLILVKLFIIFHDMGHGSFFPNKKMNYIVATLIGPLVTTPISFWKKSHNYHHVNSNKINMPQHGQTAVWDNIKYKESSNYSRFFYKFCYGKFTLFTVNPVIYFLIINRFLSKWYELILQFVYWYILYKYIDPSQYIYIIISIWLSGVIGFILFHVQHTFDGVYREHANEDWSYFKNGMLGCSYLQLPKILHFFALNIQYHHIHHLNSNVPCYNLKQCHEDWPELFSDVPRVYLSDIPRLLKYSIFNSKTKKFEDVYQYKDD